MKVAFQINIDALRGAGVTATKSHIVKLFEQVGIEALDELNGPTAFIRNKIPALGQKKFMKALAKLKDACP